MGALRMWQVYESCPGTNKVDSLLPGYSNSAGGEKLAASTCQTEDCKSGVLGPFSKLLYWLGTGPIFRNKS